MKELSTFIGEYGSHRINIIINSLSNFKNDIKIINALKIEHPESNLVMAVPEYVSLNDMDLLKEYHIPFYINKNIINLDEFDYLLKCGVSEIKIGGELGFFVKFLSSIAKKNNIKLRAEADICQGNNINGESFKNFFIRPEDIIIYNKYIDTFELVHDKSFINTIYETYTRKKKWYGKLNELIINYHGTEDSRFILPIVMEKRCTCRKACIYNDKCKMCDNIISFGETLK